MGLKSNLISAKHGTAWLACGSRVNPNVTLGPGRWWAGAGDLAGQMSCVGVHLHPPPSHCDHLHHSVCCFVTGDARSCCLTHLAMSTAQLTSTNLGQTRLASHAENEMHSCVTIISNESPCTKLSICCETERVYLKVRGCSWLHVPAQIRTRISYHQVHRRLQCPDHWYTSAIHTDLRQTGQSRTYSACTFIKT